MAKDYENQTGAIFPEELDDPDKVLPDGAGSATELDPGDGLPPEEWQFWYEGTVSSLAVVEEDFGELLYVEIIDADTGDATEIELLVLLYDEMSTSLAKYHLLRDAMKNEWNIRIYVEPMQDRNFGEISRLEVTPPLQLTREEVGVLENFIF